MFFGSNFLNHQHPIAQLTFMNLRKTIPSLVLLLVFNSLVLAQKPRGASRRVTQTAPAAQPQPTPVPAPTPTAPVVPRQPTQLAIVNGQTITTSDLDQNVAKAVESLDSKIAETRRQVLTMEINTLLLAAEASRRNISSQQLYDQQVKSRIPEPSPAEVDKVMQENSADLDRSDPATARAQVVAFLQTESEAKISADLVKRLRTTYPVVMGPDPNAPNLAPATALATVAGKPITAVAINERLKPIIYKMRLNAYEVTKDALDQTITDLLLLAEANRRSIPPEDIIRAEITSKVHPPTEAEVAKFYSENKSRISGDLATVRNQLANYLQDQEQRKLERAMAERLRKGADIRLLISAPQPPVQAVSTDDDPSQGPATAPVTIVEFTDFQCPSCAAMQPVLQDALKTYGPKVRLVIRDFPLSGHKNAYKAAEAANAANAQGKFFEYSELLFKRQKALDVPSLKQYATELGLNRTRFDAELDKGTYVAEIRKDMNDGEIYGVESTPTIFVNGVMLAELSPEGLKQAINKALAPSSQKPNP
jgi:protein-disulfide isomerase